jgi:hypothetical protein
MKRAKKSKDNTGEELKGHSVYINLKILDKTRAVSEGVTSKLQAKVGHGFFRDKITTHVGKTVGNNISDELVCKKMAEAIVDMIPSKMIDMGLGATATKVYGKGDFFVIRLTIVSADVAKILHKVGGESKANKFEQVMAMLGGQWAKDSLSEQALPLISSEIQEKLTEKMKEEFEKKGLVADIIVRSEQDQSDWFFNFIRTE